MTFWKKLRQYIGYAVYACSGLFLIGSSLIVTSDSSTGPTRDLFGLVIPNPPMWTSYIPYLGGFLQFLWSYFSLHGLVSMMIFSIGVWIGGMIVEYDIDENKESLKIKPDTFKKDFGLHLKDTLPLENSSITLTTPFSIINLIMYPDGNNSISGLIENKIVTFDMDDDILKVFLYLLQKAGMVDKDDLNAKIRHQVNTPIVLRFDENIVSGVILICKLGKPEKSSVTNEGFIPLLIGSIKITQEPAITIINTNSGEVHETSCC